MNARKRRKIIDMKKHVQTEAETEGMNRLLAQIREIREKAVARAPPIQA